MIRIELKQMVAVEEVLEGEPALAPANKNKTPSLIEVGNGAPLARE